MAKFCQGFQEQSIICNYCVFRDNFHSLIYFTFKSIRKKVTQLYYKYISYSFSNISSVDFAVVLAILEEQQLMGLFVFCLRRWLFGNVYD